MRNIRSRIAWLAAAAWPVLAQAHPGHDAGIGYVSGALHPLGGFDHLLALVAVGLLAARMGGRALLAIPAAFLALLAAGIVLGGFAVYTFVTRPTVESRAFTPRFGITHSGPRFFLEGQF